MRWSDFQGFRKRFAFLPVLIGREWVWLETYWSRSAGEYTEVSLHEPAQAILSLSQPKGQEHGG